jgi:hypothetical protein
LSLLVVLHVGLGLHYSNATPIFEAPDEAFHFAVVRWIGLGNGLPVQRPDQVSDWEQEGSQPPLYYVLGAALTRGIATPDWEPLRVRNPHLRHEPGNPHNHNAYRHSPLETPAAGGTTLAVHLARWFSLVLSTLNVLLVYGLALAVLPGQEWLALLAAALAGLNPQALFINASVNNDNLLMPLSTAALWLMVLNLAPGRRHTAGGWRDTLLGLLLGLAALTKISGLVLWPVAALALGWGAVMDWRERPGVAVARRAVRLLAKLGWVFGLALLVCGWWYWRNLQLYGDWLGLAPMLAVVGRRLPPISLPALIRQEWYGFFVSYWAVFGVFSLLPAAWVHTFYGVLTLAALGGGALALLRRPLRLPPALVLLGLFCLLALAGIVRWTMQTFASQGRLLFVAIAPLSVFMAAGLLALTRPVLRLRAGRGWAGGFVLTLAAALALVATVIPDAYIAPGYAPPTVVAEADLPADLRPVQAIFGGEIELLGYTTQAAPVAPGETISVTLYWRGLQPIPADYSLALHVLGRGQAVEVGKLDTWPGGGNAATSQWVPGEIYADRYVLPVAVDAETPTQLWLDLNFWDQHADDRLPVALPDGSPAGTVKVWLGRAVGREAPDYEPEQALLTQFENGIVLLGYDASANGALFLTLYWQLEANERLLQDYTVFLHLTDEQGVLVREPADAPPLDGDWPTSAWLPGREVADARLIALPPNLLPGRYNLRLGLYDPVSGARLAAYQPGGTRWPEDVIVIEGIVVR